MDELEATETEPARKARVPGREYIASRVQAVAVAAETRGMDGASMLIDVVAEAITNTSGRQFLDFAFEVRDLWRSKYAPPDPKRVIPFSHKPKSS